MDNTQSLISGYLDDELTDDDVAQLAGRLRADPDAVDQFVLDGFVHSHLNEWMDQQRVQDDALGGRSVADLARRKSRLAGSRVLADSLDCDCSELADEPPTAARRWRPAPRTAAALAATLLVALASYFVVSRPVVVAQLTEATGCKWDASQPNRAVGEFLKSGQELRLVEGKALITFGNGAQILLEGPTTLELNSVSEVRLESGLIAAKVPIQAIGFAVTTSLAQFVDLGTAFTLKLDADKTFELYVFEGLVELQLNERFGEEAHQPLRVPEVRAVHFDVKAADISWLPFNQGEEMPF